MEGKNLVVFVVDDNKKQRVKRCYHQMLHFLTNGQGVNADLSHSLKQCTLSQQESLFSAKIEFFYKGQFWDFDFFLGKQLEFSKFCTKRPNES